MGLKRLVSGVVLVFVALVMLLTSGNSALPYVGAVIGIVGAVLVISSIVKTGFRSNGGKGNREHHGRNRARRL